MNLGVLGQGARASVNDRGAIEADDLSFDWWVGADDRWHFPADDAATWQQRMGAAPIVETVVRVPGGDVAQRAYAVSTATGSVVVVEVENRSPVPLTVALVVRVARGAVVEVDGSVMLIDGAPALVLSSPPRAWAAAASTAAIVTGGAARTDAIETVRGPVELALLFPVPHRTCVRAAIGDVGPVEPGAVPINVRELPDADAVARGWDRQLERGLQVELPPPAGELVDAARADLLLAPRTQAAVVAALEDWGFDDEAADGWARLGLRGRRQAGRRARPAEPWSAVRAADAVSEPVEFLSALHAALVRDDPAAIELLPGFPPEWLGQSLTVDAMPLRAGMLSFAVRWHGARPALQWDAPDTRELRVRALDPAWSSRARAGETLLAEPSTALLSMGTRERSVGEPVDAPGQFS